jgi:hypothetical protein
MTVADRQKCDEMGMSPCAMYPGCECGAKPTTPHDAAPADDGLQGAWPHPISGWVRGLEFAPSDEMTMSAFKMLAMGWQPVSHVPPSRSFDPTPSRAAGTEAVQAGELPEDAPEVERVADGYVIAPHFRGYALLGTEAGAYFLSHSMKDAQPELYISVAPPALAEKLTPGDTLEFPDGTDLPVDSIAVRLGFASEVGLATLERQLRLLRETHFAPPAALTAALASPPSVAVAQEAVAYRWRSAGDTDFHPMRMTPGEMVNGRMRHITHPDPRLEYAYLAPAHPEAAKDAERFVALAGMDAVAINAWLVQVRANKDAVWVTRYYQDPPSGPPPHKAESRLGALRAAIDAALASSKSQGREA